MTFGKTNCPNCGIQFEKIRKNQKFCSKKCYSEIHRPMSPRQRNRCPECSRDFQGTKKDKYCSDECRKKVKNRKNDAYRKKTSVRMKCRVCGRMFYGRNMSPVCSSHCRSLFNKGVDHG